MNTIVRNNPVPSAPGSRRGPYGIMILIVSAGLLLALTACEGRPAPPAPPTTPTAGAVVPAASVTPAAPPPPDARQPDYTPVVGAGGVPYVPPEPWLAAPTLAPGQPTPTPYGEAASGPPGRKPGSGATPSPSP